MTDAITPEVMDEWLAYESLDPDPLDRIAEILKRGFAFLCTLQLTDEKTMDPADFEPAYKTARDDSPERARKEPRREKRKRRRQPLQEVSPNQAAAMMTMAMGPGRPSPLKPRSE